jgi:hypothetical protein
MPLLKRTVELELELELVYRRLCLMSLSKTGIHYLIYLNDGYLLLFLRRELWIS